MNRLITSLTQKCARLTISTSCYHSPSSSVTVPPPAPYRSSIAYDMPNGQHGGPNTVVPFTCPGLENIGQVYTFPTLDRSPILAPAPFLQQILEKMDPEMNKAPMQAPSAFPVNAVWASPRLLTIRRKKMKKHKRRKRYDRDFFKYQKYHKEKKLKAEREFVKRMKSTLVELETFNPEKYVEETIALAKKEWSDDFAPTGRKLYPHWSRIMAIEELYGLPDSDYIDKFAGLPTEEDREKIIELKKEYKRKFLGELTGDAKENSN